MCIQLSDARERERERELTWRPPTSLFSLRQDSRSRSFPSFRVVPGLFGSPGVSGRSADPDLFGLLGPARRTDDGPGEEQTRRRQPDGRGSTRTEGADRTLILIARQRLRAARRCARPGLGPGGRGALRVTSLSSQYWRSP